MKRIKIDGVRMRGVASAVPGKRSSKDDFAAFFENSEIEKISKSTGVDGRYIAPDGVCTSDLCWSAAETLLRETACDRDSIDTLIFVTQTPDYILPATSCSLHCRLQLSKSCTAFDINLGCSGYLYGLWTAASLLAAGSADRVLLLVGDTITKIVSPKDRSVALLFGDAGTATIIERDQTAPPMYFALGTDGSGQNHLIVPAGGFRHPHTESSAARICRENGNYRSEEDLYMNGPEIFAFTLREVPSMIEAVHAMAGWNSSTVDAYVMHQANQFMLEHLAKRLKLPKEKTVLAMKDYGNTSSASIPLALSAAMGTKLKTTRLQMILAGFGVGYSFGAAAVTAGPMVIPDIVTV